MPKARPVNLHPEASGLWLVQTAHSHTLLVDTHPGFLLSGALRALA